MVLLLSGWWSSLRSAFHSAVRMPKTKLLASNPGAEAMARMSPFVTSMTAAAALSPAMRCMA